DEIFKGFEFADCSIDGETFSHAAEVESEGAKEADGPAFGIEPDIAITDRFIVGLAHDLAGAMFASEAESLHTAADGGVEGAIAHLRNHEGKPDGFIEHWADRGGVAGSKLHEFARGVEAGTAAFDFVEPAEGAVDGGVRVRSFRGNDTDGHEGIHGHFTADAHRCEIRRGSLRFAEGFDHR